VRVVVIGAGLAGLVAARELVAAGADVTVLERGRSPGGRLATRRIGDATFDHGAQFFTVRTPAFATTVERWVAAGLVDIWNHGFGEPDGHPRYIAPRGMNSLAKELARPLGAHPPGRIELDTMAFAVRRSEPDTASDTASDLAPLRVIVDDGSERPADAVISTCPLPQTFSLLVDAGIEFDEQVFRTDYDRTLTLLALLDRPPRMLPTGGVQPDDPRLGFVGDNVSKGVSRVPALTVHASGEWSEAHWNEGDDEIVAGLVGAAAPWLGDAAVVDHQLKRWRFATPRTISPDPCWIAPSGDIVAAGDAFAGPRVEGAHNSGLAAARALLG
jgi:predicted NAD/FAD-dependent oxidoreductase